MARFDNQLGIILDDEERQTLADCNGQLSNPDRRKSKFKNLLQALEEGFVGWEIK